MDAGIGPIRNAVAVDVEVAAEILACLQLGFGHDLAAVEPPRVVPIERLAEPLVHADVEVEQDEDRRLQPVGQIESIGTHGEALMRVFGEEQHMLGVAMGGIGAGEHVGLLGAGRHAGRGAAALHVEDDRRDLGEIGEPDELLHERDAGAGGCGEGPGAVPGGADDDADGGELVLGLDDRVVALLGDRIDPVAPAVAGEGLGEEPDRAGERLERVLAAHVERLDVGLDQLVLALELLADQHLDHLDVDVEQRRQGADIDDVLEQLALARVRVFAVADLGQRHADEIDVVAEPRARQGLGGIVEEVAAGLDLGHILVPGLRVHGDRHVDAAACAQMARLGDPHLVPGWQALDVRGEDVARRDRHAHAQDRLGEELVGARRAGAVDVGELDDEVVGSFYRL